MAGLEDCIASAQAQGALERDEAEELKARYRAIREALKATDHPGGPEAAAKDALLKDIEDEATRKERLAQLAADRTAEISDYLTAYRDAKGKPDVTEAALGLLENRNNALAGTPSVVGRRDALIGYAHGRLEQYLYEFRRTFGLGKRMNAGRLDHVVDEAFGKGTGDPAARGFLDAWRQIADELVDRFNAAGGDVAKMREYFPQSHDARKIVRDGEQAWVDFIKPRLDAGSMVDPRSGSPVGDRLDEVLHAIYRRIVTDGAIERQPSSQPFGRGALANRRQEERFLHFKDAAAWRDYAAAYGNPNAYAVMMEHLHGLAKDTAALEILGPNPNATVEWMRQVVQSEAAKRQVGEPSLYKGNPVSNALGRLLSGDYRIKNLWTVVNGSAGAENLAAADVISAAQNVIMSSQLAGATIAAVLTDPGQALASSRFAGISGLRWLAELPRQILSEHSERDILRAGLIFEDATEHLRGDFRRLGWAAMSKEASRFLPDRVFTWTGLQPFDMAKRRTSAYTFMFDAGDRAGMTLEAMHAAGGNADKFARYLEGFGISEDDWALIGTAKGLDHGEAGRLLRPIDVVDAHPDDAAAFDAFLKYSEAMHAFAEDAGPRGTNRARTRLGAANPKGSVSGFLSQQALSYLSYPTTTLMSLYRATAMELAAGGLGRGIGYIAPAVVAMTVMGAATLQVKSMLRGQDPEPVTSPDFWARALARGGALGFWGDYLLADYSRGSGDIKSHLAGPVIGTALDLLGAIGGFRSFTQEHDMNRPARLLGFVRQNTPVATMWWLKPVMERAFWDRMQRLADPKADASWRRRANQVMKETGAGTWWPHGQMVPDRAPRLF